MGADQQDCLVSEDNEEQSGSPHRLRERAALARSGLKSPQQLRKPQSGIQKMARKGIRGQWSDESLKLAIDALDQGYKMAEVSRKYEIPRSSLRDNFEGRTRNRKMGPKTILSKEEEEKLVEYIELMVHWGHPMTPIQVKSKVAEITQERVTPFKNGFSGESWLHWFRARHPELVLRVPQPLDHKRARVVNPESVAQFYCNLATMYNTHHYPPNCVWNIDETGCQATQSGQAKVFAKRGVRGVHKIVPGEREWLSVLSAINASGQTIPNYYIFKGIRKLRDYTMFCEEGALLGMQKKRLDGQHTLHGVNGLFCAKNARGRRAATTRETFSDTRWT